MPVRIKQRSFAAGEIAEEFYGHEEYRIFQTGLARCRGFVVKPGGGLTRLPPTELITLAYDKSILIDMSPGSQDVFTIELGHLKARFFRNGAQLLDGAGRVYEIAHPYQAQDHAKLRWEKSGDTLFLTHPVRGMWKLVRRGNVDWMSQAYVFDKVPFADENGDEAKTLRVSGEINAVTLEAGGWIFSQDMVGEQLRLRDFDQRVIPAWVSNENVSPGAHRSYNGRIYRQQAAVAQNAGPNPPTHTEGTRRATSGGCLWKFVRDGYGIVLITSVTSPTTANGTVLVRLPEEFTANNDADYDGQAKSFRWSQQAFSAGNGWPETIRIHGQRLYLGKNNRFWASEQSDYYSFEYGATPDKALSETLGSSTGRTDDIKWMSSGKVLMVGASGDEFSLSAGSIKEGISPSSLRIDLATSDGSSDAQPVRAKSATLHVSEDGLSLYEIIYDFQIDDFNSDDRAQPSFHLLAHGLRKIVYQRNPMRIIWGIDGSGVLVGFTYNPRQEVFGWHYHPKTDCVIEDICVTPSTDQIGDDLWLRVRRNVCGVSQVFIERMRNYFMRGRDVDPTLIPYLDCQVTAVGCDINSVGALKYLKGQKIAAISNRGFEGEFTVDVNGCIDLKRDGIDRVTIGIPYRSHGRTLPQVPSLDDGPAERRLRVAKGMRMRALGGAGALAGDIGDPDHAETLFPGQKTIDAKAGLRVPANVTPVSLPWGDEGQIDFWTDDAYPFEISTLAIDYDFGGH